MARAAPQLAGADRQLRDYLYWSLNSCQGGEKDYSATGPELLAEWDHKHPIKKVSFNSNLYQSKWTTAAPPPPVPNARAITVQEGSMQEHLFLQYQFQQHPQTILLMKSGFFFPGPWKPQGTTNGEFTNLPPAAKVCSVAASHSGTHQWTVWGGGMEGGEEAGWQHVICPGIWVLYLFPRPLPKYFGGLRKETLSLSQCGKGCLDLRAFKLVLCFYPAVTPQSQC